MVQARESIGKARRLLSAVLMLVLTLAPLAADAHMTRVARATSHAVDDEAATHAVAYGSAALHDHSAVAQATASEVADGPDHQSADPGCCTTYCHAPVVLAAPFPSVGPVQPPRLEPETVAVLGTIEPDPLERPPAA